MPQVIPLGDDDDGDDIDDNGSGGDDDNRLVQFTLPPLPEYR